LLPQGGQFSRLYKSEQWKGLQERLAQNIDTFENQVNMEREEDAEVSWGMNDNPEAGLYKRLNQPRIGLWGAVTARAPQMVLRLALITAAVNGAKKIQLDHLDAASEIWRYCDDSTKYIFGDKMDDQVAIAIMKTLREHNATGLTRTQIHRIWNGHQKRGDIDRALLWISHTGIARTEKVDTGGRPVETWYAI
jgi:hypothetical protein